MSVDRILAEKHLNDAAARLEESRKIFEQESGENRRACERFYNNLALFSGGTVALSVTYLGYLKSLTKPPTHPMWLVGSWGCLLLCLALSLFCTLFNTHYAHFARLRQHVDNIKRKRIAEAEAISPLMPVNLTPA
jgi:hypothetical protein